MKFKILSVKGNSVRIKTGIATFDLKVMDGCKLVLPPDIYIADRLDFNNLVGAVLAEYNKSMEINKSNDKTETIL